MAALLRHGAASLRLGGSTIQRAVAEGRRRVGPRLMHTDEYSHRGIEREIQQKKEELYDLIAKGQQNVRTSTSRNAWLLLHLSEEVTPRPYEPLWCDLQSSSSGISLLKRARLYVLGLAVIDCVIRYKQYCEEKKLARAMTIEEELEARKVETRSRRMEN